MGAPDDYLEQAAAHGITRIALIVVPGSHEEGAQPWTCLLTRDDGSTIVARGPTEDLALYEALRCVGVVT